MYGYVKALRLPIVVMAGLLAITAFRVSVWQPDAYLVALFIVVVASSTMAHNDWRDRKHDAKKGKDFALKHQAAFRVFTISLWGCSFALALLLWFVSQQWGIISSGIILSGLLYSETRRIPLLPQSLVALTSASPTLYAGLSDHRVLALFLASALLIFGREILKDSEDYPHDAGYKWTLPLTIGNRASKFCSGVILLLVPLVVGVSTKTLAGMPFLSVTALFLILNREYKSVKILLFVGMVMLIIPLLVSGP